MRKRGFPSVPRGSEVLLIFAPNRQELGATGQPTYRNHACRGMCAMQHVSSHHGRRPLSLVAVPEWHVDKRRSLSLHRGTDDIQSCLSFNRSVRSSDVVPWHLSSATTRAMLAPACRIPFARFSFSTARSVSPRPDRRCLSAHGPRLTLPLEEAVLGRHRYHREPDVRDVRRRRSQRHPSTCRGHQAASLRPHGGCARHSQEAQVRKRSPPDPRPRHP